MSGIIGMYRTDGRAVEPAVIGRMVDAIAHRGPDGRGVWASGPIGLGHRLLYTTPESLDERQPVTDEARDCRLVWDGRVDNREELIAALDQSGVREGATDPKLVLHAYRRWGVECVQRIIGEFAFALWDGRVQTLFCARDRLGLKPLHYVWRGATLLVSSEIKPLLAVHGTTLEPDDEMIVAFLLREFRERDHGRTLFRGIHRLPPGHALVVNGAGPKVERYWAIEPTRETRYARDEEYAEHFLALFGEAVRCRLRSEFPVGVFVSGGLDSSAILCTAERLTGERPGPVPPIEAFTLFSDDPDSDERQYVRKLLGAGGDVKGHEIHASDDDPLHRFEELMWETESPIVGAARQSTLTSIDAVLGWGCRVLLSGDGGDHLLDETGYLADLLATLRLRRFLGETRAFADWYGGDARQLGGMALAMILPTEMKFRLKRLARRAPPAWINPHLARAMYLDERLREPRHRLRFPSYAQADSYLSVTNPYHVLKIEVDERSSAWYGTETRYPFLDSRLVEFVLSVPPMHRTRDGERKHMLRAAMRGIVPQAVRLRRGKGDWTSPMDRVLTALCQQDPPAPLENRSGGMERYVDLGAARKLVARYLAGRRDLRWEVWFLITVDRWLERFWGKAS